tara:strand:- start:1487 stop:1996 length:510 start_codon:yes stop_codon:yes gene_type:complete
MILNCSSCDKKFVVPDQAITASGRLVQCGSCGNKWKQFPIKDKIVKTSKSENKKVNLQKRQSKIKAPKPIKKKRVTREINLYSPEYLAKKHGISLKDEIKTVSKSKKVSFGFYNSLILFLVIIIALSKGLHFSQEIIVQKLPFTEFYINYFFESMRNVFEIWKNLVSSY